MVRQQPIVVGLAGGVASGKTTITQQLITMLDDAGIAAQSCSTDNFLKTNAQLVKIGLTDRKGWPDSYELSNLINFINRYKQAKETVYSIPYYCHANYDILPNNYLHLFNTKILIIEGVVALNPKIVQLLDFAIYLDTKAEFSEQWFYQRCKELIKAAKPKSFYHKWSLLEPDQVEIILNKCWREINLKNLYENIEITKKNADLVIVKDSEHNFVDFINA